MWRHVIPIAIAAGLAGGCQTAAEPPQATEAKPPPIIGKKRYFRSHLGTMVCPTPMKFSVDPIKLNPGCRHLRSGSATVEVVETVPNHRYGKTTFYRVTLNDGSTGYVDTIDWMMMVSEEERAANVAEKAACDRKGGIAVGMTAEQVKKSCWGSPSSINRTITGSTNREQWVYPGYNYVYVTNGIVTTVQTSQ